MTQRSKDRVRRVSCDIGGIRRHRNGDGFRYVGPDGKAVPSEVRERLDALAIPPAWEEVWICPDADCHIQATGRDARGRKQYIYHPRFRETQDADKFARLIDFGRALPGLRDALRADLRRPGLPREKVLAAAVRVLERSFTRVGSERYARENHSYGVSTLEEEHVRELSAKRVRFQFPGKGGKCIEVDLTDRKVAEVVRACEDLPGERLFEWLDEDGKVHAVDSSDINHYLRDTMGGFTSKDFRTWAATTLMMLALRDAEGALDEDTDQERERAVRDAVKLVAERLSNTPAVCKKSYIHPAVPAAFLDRTLSRRIEELASEEIPEEGLWPEERQTLALLASYLPRATA